MSSSERYIENAVIRDPGSIGFPGADIIRNVRAGRHFGRVDLLLLPPSGQYKVVLVEAKRTVAADAASKVLGQLLMYYSGAMRIGSSGLECYRNFAKARPADARSRRPVTGVALTGGKPVPEAWRLMESGEKLKASEIALLIGLDSEPHECLWAAVTDLREWHGLDVGIFFVRNRRCQLFGLPKAIAPPIAPLSA